METEKIIKDYEHEKHQERKRKGAHLEAIFEQAAKKSTRDNNENNNKNRSVNTGNENLASRSNSESIYESTGQSSANSRNCLEISGNSLGNIVSSHGDTRNPITISRCSPGRNVSSSGDSVNTLRDTRNGIIEHSRNILCAPSRPLEKANNSLENTSRGVSNSYDHESRCLSRESERESPEREMEVSDGDHYTGFKQIRESGLDTRSVSSVKESKSSDFQTTVTIKQEKSDDPPKVEIMPVTSQALEPEKSSMEDNGEIGEDCLKFLLFSGKLYHCERISDLTHSFSRFIGDSVLGRKGKVVVLLLFHKTSREVLNYVVGVVDHYTLEEHNVIIKVIKHHNYPTTTPLAKEVEKRASKLVVGSKKLLYNLQPLNGPVYSELVKILDGFGANSAVDHAKISEFNAMVNANVDRLDGQISNVLGRAGYPYRGTFTNINFVSPAYSYMGSRYQSSSAYSPLANQLGINTRFSPEKSHGGSTNVRSKSVDAEIEDGYPRKVNTSYHRDGLHVNTVSANQTVRITPRTANSNVDHIRAASAVPIVPTARFRSTLDDGSLTSQRRNVEGISTHLSIIIFNLLLQ